MKGDPQSILKFLEFHFDTITQLYRIQKQENVIVKETFLEICEKSQPKINSQTLQTYQIARRNANGDFEIPIDYEKFLSFLLSDFKQTLTDSLEKQSQGLASLLDKLQYPHNDPKIIISIIHSMIDLVKSLCSDIEKQIEQLIQEQIELKQNKEGHYSYISKMEKMDFWVKNHITPLNSILDHHHGQSIIYMVRQIRAFSSKQKEVHPIRTVRNEFDKLTDQLYFADATLQIQARRIRETLLPFIDRVKIESRIWSGFMQILKDFKLKKEIKRTPLFKINRFKTYSFDFDIAKEFEKHKEQAPIETEEAPIDALPPYLWQPEKDRYKILLLNQLPIYNFMLWCHNLLYHEFGKVDKDRFLSLTTLIFEADLQIDVTSENIELELLNHSFVVPIIHLSIKK